MALVFSLSQLSISGKCSVQRSWSRVLLPSAALAGLISPALSFVVGSEVLDSDLVSSNFLTIPFRTTWGIG